MIRFALTNFCIDVDVEGIKKEKMMKSREERSENKVERMGNAIAMHGISSHLQ